MIQKSNITRVLMTATFFAINVCISYAQVSFGADVVSRYVWRGNDFGDSPSIQPDLKYSSGSWTIGTWAAYPFAIGASVSEHDVYVNYSYKAFGIGVTDYFFPEKAKFFNYGIEGNHVIEPNISFTGPVRLLVAVNVMNDNENSVYIELGYTTYADDVKLTFFAGGTTGASNWYGTRKAGLLSVGVTGSKNTFGVTYILNPTTQKTYLTFGVSF